MRSQIQALDRTQPILPLRPGLPERQAHDYTRHDWPTQVHANRSESECRDILNSSSVMDSTAATVPTEASAVLSLGRKCVGEKCSGGSAGPEHREILDREGWKPASGCNRKLASLADSPPVLPRRLPRSVVPAGKGLVNGHRRRPHRRLPTAVSDTVTDTLWPAKYRINSRPLGEQAHPIHCGNINRDADSDGKKTIRSH